MAVTPIVPSTALRFLRGVPLDSSYTDTLTFNSVSAQTTYFLGKVKYSYDNYGPVRMQSAIRVSTNATNLYDCNYIMFQNKNWNDKWFYAFITRIDFVNTNMCEVYYEIDVMQSWMFDMQLKDCFVEREHIADDTIGNNLVAENLELGDYVTHGITNSNSFTEFGIMIASSYDGNGAVVAGAKYVGVYAGVRFFYFGNPDDANSFIERLTNNNQQDGIVAIYMFPYDFIDYTSLTPHRAQFSMPKAYSNIDGYKPKNNKLFTYPYNFLLCTNYTGNYAEYKYEFCESTQMQFQISGDMTPSASFLCVPLTYKGSDFNYNEAITLTGLPMCTYNTDSYKAWLAQNQSSLTLTTLSTGLSTLAGGAMLAGGLATGNIGLSAIGAGKLMGGVGGALNTLAKVGDASAVPNHVKGNLVNNIMFAEGNFNFGFIPTTITAQTARIIDNFFTMYGYATHQVKTPNIKSRPRFNYLKTQHAVVTGNICFDHLDMIKRILDNGITFWHGDWVGDYATSNK